MRLIDADAKMVAQLNDFETESVVEKEMTVDDYLSLSDYDAPTIDAVPHWIPYEERLPEEDGFYLVTIQWDDQSKSVEIFWYTNEFKFGDSKDYTITAWMPSPKPYEGERKDDDARRSNEYE